MPAPGPMTHPPQRAPRETDAGRAENARGTFVRLARYFANERALAFAMLAAVAAATVFGVIAPALQSRAVDCIATGNVDGLLPLTAGTFGAYIAYSLCQLAQGCVNAHLSTRVDRRMRQDLFDRIMDLPVGRLDAHPRGDLMSRMTNDVENIAFTASEALPSLLGSVLTLVGTAAAMLALCWQLALLSFLTVLLTLGATRFLSRRVRRFSLEQQRLLGTVNATVEETARGFRTVTAFNRQKALLREFRASSDALAKAGVKASSFAGVMGPIMNGINNAGFVVTAVFGGLFALHGITTVGVISAFIVYVRQFGRPVGDLAQIYGRLQSALASAERIFEVMDQPPEDPSGGELPATGSATVTFEHVDFSYVPGRPVLKDFCLTVPAGRKVALVGATGSGKTTVVSLLERFYDPDAGSVRIDGVDVRTIARSEVRRNVAIVLQDTTLITGTVLENLRYARPDVTLEEAQAAVEMSCCADVVAALPNGFDTMLENGGAALSQGQRQLLAIARAFVADPRVLVLDEATSNVDTRTEKAVQDAMQRLMENRTSIVIAHRLSTVQDADLIVVMDHGRVRESGTHEELLAAGGVYRQLYETQFAGVAT